MGGSKELTNAQAELFDACRRGEYEKVRAWFAAKKNKRPKTPLSIFRPSTPQNWLSSMRDPSTQYTVLHYSALNGREQISKLLIDFEPVLALARDKRGCIPLHLAAWNGHLSICKMLIHLEPTSVDTPNSAQETALHLASQHGHSAVVQLLLQKHADASTRNARHESPLDIACRMGHAAVCTVITSYCPELALQAKVDASSTEENSVGTARILYPLHVAARYSHVDCMRILKSAGFDINFITEEGSALHVAARFGQIVAVKYLLEEGINQNLLDCRGMTALDVLAEVETQKVSDLTQIIQSRSYWSECRRMIEQDVLKNGDTTYSSSDSGIDRRDLATSEPHNHHRSNGTTGGRHSAERDIVWQKLPEASNVLSRSQHCSHSHQHAPAQPSYSSSSGVYRPPSITAEFSFLNDQDNMYGEPGQHYEYDARSMSRIPSQSMAANRDSPNSVNRTWNSRMVDNKGVPKFPSTCPHMKAPLRAGGTLPSNMSSSQVGNSRTRPSPPRGTILPHSGECVYKAPPHYDAWAAASHSQTPPFPTTNSHSLNAPPIYNAAKPYDNVPRNLLVYDNAPPPGHKRWDHFCSLDRSMGHSIVDNSLSEISDGRADSIKEDSPDPNSPFTSGIRTLPVRGPKKRPSLASITNCAPIKESSPATTSQQGVEVEKESTPFEKEKSPKTPNLSDKEASSSMTYSSYLANREGSRVSNITCSTLERTASPTARSDDPNGRAPLALPEELTASTTNSVISSSLTPEREQHSDSADLRSEVTTINQTGVGSDTIEKQQSTSTMRLLRDSDEPNDTGASVTPPSISSLSIENKDPPSPNTSQHIIFQYCTKLQHDNLANGNRVQQLPFSPSGTEYSDSTVASSCSLPMISNISTTPPSVSSPKKSLPGNELDAQQLPWTFDVRFRHPKSAIELPHHKSLRNGSSSKSIDLEEEWKKIDDIIASYGAAACRESVFERDYLQKVAVFLRDRSSKALTVLNTRPNSTESRNIPVYQMETADWLMRMFSMPETEAQQIGGKLCDLGYDKYTQMKGSLNRDVMTEVSIKEDVQDKIMRYLDYANDPRPNANHFNYVSDWLCSLELTEYLSNFFDAGYKSMGIVMGAKITPEILEKLSITKPGHVSRILYSLQQATEETRKWAYEQGQEIIHSPRSNDNLHNRERSLMHGSVTFSAHYLGSAEVSNIDRTVESRNAMAKLKREVSDISRTSPVTLEISTAGVSIWEPGSEFATMEHPLGCIAIVCQDAKDLNCFAYISQESHTHFAHVFCVLTADAASEIIFTLGMAFNMAHANMVEGRVEM